MSKRVVTLGEIMLRLKAPGVERFFQSPTLEATFGGGEGNVATSLANFGFKDVNIEYSTDDQQWYTLADVPQFAKAAGKLVCAADTTVDFGGVEAKYVKLTALKNWGSFIYQQYTFKYQPKPARYSD